MDAAMDAYQSSRNEFAEFEYSNPYEDQTNFFEGLDNVYDDQENKFADMKNMFEGQENAYEGMQN